MKIDIIKEIEDLVKNIESPSTLEDLFQELLGQAPSPPPRDGMVTFQSGGSGPGNRGVSTQPSSRGGRVAFQSGGAPNPPTSLPVPAGPSAPLQPAAINQTGGFVLGSAPSGAPLMFVSIIPMENYHLVPPGNNLMYQVPVNVAPKALPGSVFPAPPPTSSTPKKRKRGSHEDDDRLYIKKPPNAFMLYLKEQRPKVVAELNISESAAVNAIVGGRWKSLSRAEQAKYYYQAEAERGRHREEHPEWTSKENYGKKRKRSRKH